MLADAPAKLTRDHRTVLAAFARLSPNAESPIDYWEFLSLMTGEFGSWSRAWGAIDDLVNDGVLDVTYLGPDKFLSA